MSFLFRKIKLVRNIYWVVYHWQLRKVARFIRKHRLYPVNLTEDLLDVWEQNVKL